MSDWPYIYFWHRCGRKGQPCRVTARGKMNSCRVEFSDGFVMITSRNAIRHGGHNKIDLETRMKAFVWWQRHDFTNAQVEEFAGIPYATMRGWWQGEHPRPVTRGRPKGSADNKPRRTR